MKKKDSGIYLDKPIDMVEGCCPTVSTMSYNEEMYEQLLILNGKIERFLQFIKYAAVGGFLTTGIYFMMKIGKLF